MRLYLDASAAIKLIWAETESAAMRAYVVGHELVATDLLDIELARVVHRLGQPLSIVAPLMAMVSLAPINRSVTSTAKLFPDQHLGSLDAIHLAGAIGFAADELLTYDGQLARAAANAGVVAVAP